ncbi:response regulator [Magnetovibrio sp.]|uniref:response regulator n=1 Tax=Magnetovibrio sp. TaxID=2024836 RepID=UPI002F9411EE
MRVMDYQGLKHCSVLVADDSAATRMLLATSLHDIGVGVVNTVSNGVAAIEHLRHSATSSITGQTPPVDLLITEWDMEPVGGMMLINWVRRHQDSPDRFTRTMIMSGELDAEKVERARNSGVNAVFAKPFSINSLRKHITHVLSNNPPYFKSRSYFGPDRRRHAPDAVLEERRRVQKPYGEKLGVGQYPDVGCFDLPHYLSEIALGRARERIDFGERHLAHQVLLRHSEDYVDWIRGDVEVLRLAFRLADENPEMRARNMALMGNLIHRLEREGTLLGYPLISAFSHTLANAIKADTRLWRQTAEIFDAALSGLDTVVRQNVRGDGGAVGKALSGSLGRLNKKLLSLRPLNAHRQGIARFG